MRKQLKLPSQMACSVMRQVGATYKALWTKVKRNAEHRKAGYTKKRFKGLDNPPKYMSPVLTYVYGYNYTFKPEQRVRLSTLLGRIIVPFRGYDPHIALIQHGAIIGEAKLWYDKSRKQFYLLVSLKREITDPIPTVQQTIVGVDVGQRYLEAVREGLGRDLEKHNSKREMW